MRSSSELFPTRLISAEIYGPFSVDSYLLKPNNSPDKSVELAVTRIAKEGKPAQKPPIICLHGSFSNRMLWLPRVGDGLAHYLASHDYEVWLPEMRGHGLSPMNRDYLNTRWDDVVKLDLPAISDFVAEQTDRKPIWICHSLGGAMLLGSLTSQSIDPEQVASVVLMATQVNHVHWSLKIPLMARLSAWLVKRQGIIEGYKREYGPENEPSQLLSDIISWQSSKGWKSKDGHDYWESLAGLGMPALCVASTGDIMDKKDGVRALHDQLGACRKEYKKFNFTSETGYRSHYSMVLSQEAKRYVWPYVLNWLESMLFDGDLKVA